MMHIDAVRFGLREQFRSRACRGQSGRRQSGGAGADEHLAMCALVNPEALVPLDATSGWHSGEPPETYPEGI